MRAQRARRGAAAEGVEARPALSVWVRLLRCHALVLRELRTGMPEGLTLPQFDVLAQLARSHEGMSPGELTRALLVTAGNVTGIVERLARAGLAERRPVPSDGRAVRVRLTLRGRRLVQRALPRHRQAVEALLEPVGAPRLAQLRDLLGEVHRVLERSAP
jgi:DNA-binding MarR family transcriptional regulator